MFRCPHCGETITQTVQGRDVIATKAQQRILRVLKIADCWLPTVAIAARVARSKSCTRQVLDRLHRDGRVEVTQNGSQLEWRVP